MSFRLYIHEIQGQTEPAASPAIGPAISLPDGLSFELWRPSLLQLWPPDSFRAPLLVWAIFHYLGIFRNREYGIFLIRDQAGRVQHYSGLYPGYFRFPYMSREDLQIGDTWTSPDWRQKGLALFAVRKIVESVSVQPRQVSYICAEDNLASIKVIEKAGFRLSAKLERTQRFGLRVLGQYQVADA